MEVFDSMVDKVRTVQKLRVLQQIHQIEKQAGPANKAYVNQLHMTLSKINSATIIETETKTGESSVVKLGRYRFQ
jgi:hypothetical protein